jgi:hypothetical protein
MKSSSLEIKAMKTPTNHLPTISSGRMKSMRLLLKVSTKTARVSTRSRQRKTRRNRR